MKSLRNTLLILAAAIGLLNTFGCQKEDLIVNDVYSIGCLQAKMDSFKTNVTICKDYNYIRQYTFRNETVVVFDSGLACDGTAYVLNTRCDTVGMLCGKCLYKEFEKDFFQNAKYEKTLWRG